MIFPSLRTYLCLSLSLCLGDALLSQNPITPPGVCIADPSAHVWEDGKLYVYGSLDESVDYWCSHRHHVLSTSDMKTWEVEEDVFASSGPNDAIPYNDKLLFAPDCAFKKGKYYLYYCQPDETCAEGVAVADNPTGPFKDARPLDLNGINEIDPSVFIDEDGQAYYVWGQFDMKMAKLKSNMLEIDKSTIKTGVLTEKEHFFHEGAFMTKRNGLYYLVYADISRLEMPTCIGYATSKSPMGPYQYRGIILNNDRCDPGCWNNHGSILEFNGQWYVFYHRSTHGSKVMRKACVEPIYFNSDGSITEVEMTSQGAAGPLNARARIEAEWACVLQGNLRVEGISSTEEVLTKIRNEDKAFFKYLNFDRNISEVVVRLAPGTSGGILNLFLDQPWGRQLASIPIYPSEGKDYLVLTKRIKAVSGIQKLGLQFYGEGDIGSIDWIQFR